MHNISILRSGSQSLCKRFSLEEGVVKSQRASMPAYFTFESQTVDGIEDFARLLTDLGGTGAGLLSVVILLRMLI